MNQNELPDYQAIPLLRTAKGKRPLYFSDPNNDRMFAVLVALVGEVSMLRDRLATVEKLAEQAGTFAAADVEDYQPTDEEHREREVRRAEYLRRVFMVVQESMDELAQSDPAGED